MPDAWITPRRSAPIPHDITSMMDDSPYRAGRIPALNLAPSPRPAQRPLASAGFSVDASWDGGSGPASRPNDSRPEGTRRGRGGAVTARADLRRDAPLDASGTFPGALSARTGGGQIRGSGAEAAGAKPPRRLLTELLANETSSSPFLSEWARPAVEIMDLVFP
ncbi:hypothetical protein T484DRAFT_1903967 [Baffinella frigidus]|nr:hypothetical protein T484DRAFT_1903967 [Cryptophyta sp. CCMP2293]